MKYLKGQQELRKQFRSSLSFVKEMVSMALAKNYNDPVREECAKSIAVKLRLLLIDGKNQSLFSQLGLSGKMFWSPLCVRTADLSGNLIPTFGLIGQHFDSERAFFFSAFSKNQTELRCTLSCWLDEVVFDRKQSAIHKVSRKDIILDLADKEGGAHVDPAFEEEYYHIVFESGFVMVDQNGKETRAQNNCFVEALITIAQEFIEAVEEYFDYLTGSKYCLLENDLSIIELLYEGKAVRKRYLHNRQRNIKMCLMWFYDYLNIARYRLVFTSNYLFIKNEKELFLRVIDDTKYFDVLFCICGDNTFVFLKNDNQYYRICCDDDLKVINSLKHYTFSQAVRTIKTDDHSNLDCLTKQQIYLESLGNNRYAP